MKTSLAIVVAHNDSGLSDGRPHQVQLEMLLDLLLNADPLPAKVLFFTEGVQWVANGSPIVERLKAIERKGIEIIACRSCLASSGLIDQVVVGRVGSMEGIMEAMRDAEMRVVV